MTLSTQPEKLQQVADQIGVNPNIHPLPFFYIEGIQLKLKNVVMSKKILNSSNSFIFGHLINGKLGVATGLGGGQIVLGNTVGDTIIETIRRTYIWNSLGDFNKGSKSQNLDTSQGFIQLGNVIVKNISLEHKTK